MQSHWDLLVVHDLCVERGVGGSQRGVDEVGQCLGEIVEELGGEE